MTPSSPAQSRVIALFPLWAVLFAGLACALPHWFTATLHLGEISLALPRLISPLLATIMFCMGLTLTPADFLQVAREPQKVLLGVALQFLLMPMVAWSVALLLDLSAESAIGLIVVGASAGGTASNVIAWLAGGRVALSIAMTATSTLCAVAATPLLTELYAGRSMDVPVASMMQSIAQIVVAPVLIGVIINHFWRHRLVGKESALAVVSMVCIVAVITIIVALNRPQLFTSGPMVAVAVMLHNLAGLTAGYWGARLLGCDLRDARTIAIEVGMQNSGLAGVLATKYFGAAAALPGAIFSIWQNISGPLLAGYWARRHVQAPSALGQKKNTTGPSSV